MSNLMRGRLGMLGSSISMVPSTMLRPDLRLEIQDDSNCGSRLSVLDKIGVLVPAQDWHQAMAMRRLAPACVFGVRQNLMK